MKRPFLYVFVPLLLALVVLGSVLGRVVSAKDESYKYLSNFSETLELIQKNYVDAAALDSLMQGAYRGLTEAFDPDTYYLSPADARRFRDAAALKGKAGIGADVWKRHGFAIVVSIAPEGPAAGNLSAGDYIRVIDGASTREMSVFEVRERLAGAPGTSIKLKVVRRETLDVKEITLTRAATTALPPLRADLPGGIVSLKPRQIDETTLRSLARDLQSAARAQARGVILDLRGCSEGRIADGARLADLFADSGTLLRLWGRVGEDVVKRELATLVSSRETSRPLPRDESPAPARTAGAATPRPTPTPQPSPASSLSGYEYKVAARADDTAWRGPLVILMDSSTAGAAEVAAGALRDLGRAELLGLRSFGRAAIAELMPLDDGAALHLTFARAFTPRGRAIPGQGLEPDETVEGKVTPASDPILEKAIERLKADGRLKKAA